MAAPMRTEAECLLKAAELESLATTCRLPVDHDRCLRLARGWRYAAIQAAWQAVWRPMT